MFEILHLAILIYKCHHMSEINFCIQHNLTGFKFLSLLVLNELSWYARMPRMCVLGSRTWKWKQFITNSCFVLYFITIIFAIIIFMSLQAGEGQAEIRGGVRAWAVSVCGSSCCPGCSAGGEQRYQNRWTDTQPFHDRCPLRSVPFHLSTAFSGPTAASLARKAWINSEIETHELSLKSTAVFHVTEIE